MIDLIVSSICWVIVLMLAYVKYHKPKPKQTTFCYCPVCHDELIANGNLKSDDEVVIFECTKCGSESTWWFEAPAPILFSHVDPQTGKTIQDVDTVSTDKNSGISDDLDGRR